MFKVKHEQPLAHLTDKVTPLDRFLEAAAIVGLIYLWGFTVSIFSHLPEVIPVHFDAMGVPDGWGHKSTLFVLPAVGTLCFILLSIIPRFKKFNYPFKITPQNEAIQYEYALRLLRIVKVVVLLICITLVHAIYNAITSEDPISYTWLLPTILLSVFIPIGIYLFFAWKRK